jgi:hypothetical protein
MTNRTRDNRWRPALVILAIIAALVVAVVGVLLSGGVNMETTSLRVFAGDDDACVLGGKQASAAGGPIAEVGEIIIRSSLSVLGGYVSELSRSTSSPPMTSIGNADLFKIVGRPDGNRIEPNLNCIVLLTGPFGSVPQGPLKSKQYFAKNDPDQLFVKIHGDEVNDNYLKQVGLTDLPNSYIELTIQRHNDAIMLKPRTVYFGKANTSIDNKNAKHIEITVTIVRPSTTGALQVDETNKSNLIAQIPVVISSLEPDRIHRNQLQVINFETMWISDLGPSEVLQKQVEAIHLSADQIITVTPVNILVTYREVDRPNIMLRASPGTY